MGWTCRTVHAVDEVTATHQPRQPARRPTGRTVVPMPADSSPPFRYLAIRRGLEGSQSMRLLQLRDAPPALAVAVILFSFALGTPRAASPTASAAQGDFVGFVDIGAGRHLYLECRGTGSPVVVLEAGYRSSARIWSEDLHQSGAPRTMVLAGVAVFTSTRDRGGPQRQCSSEPQRPGPHAADRRGRRC